MNHIAAQTTKSQTFRRLVLVLANTPATSNVCAAKDLDALGALLVPAYTAMNFATVCGQVDPFFVFDTSGPRGTTLEYAQHVKDEVISALGHDEAATVLKNAADTARSTARQVLRGVTSNNQGISDAEVAKWCKDHAKSYVRTFIDVHDGKHEAFLEQIERAKR